MPCKICRAPADYFDAVDFAKNCCELAGVVLPRTGRTVTYLRCGACGFIFTTYCDAFTPVDFAREIYNDDYARVDPLYRSIRPAANARLLREVLADAWGLAAPPRLLDYGAGAGVIAGLLGDRAVVRSYDPFSAEHAARPEARSEIVFSAEVIEHVTDPLATLGAMRDLLAPGGMILFSTMMAPADVAVVRAAWWYISPRNGHVSIYTHRALEVACAQTALRYTPLSVEWHLAEHRDAPCAVLDRAALGAIVARLPTGFVVVE
jgi:2-polyprenyl-6-hydroxyphenyl methylase/3-demethylubiquinone-9 3-methyltransferase